MPSSDQSRNARREARDTDVTDLRDDVIIEVEDFFDSNVPVPVKKRVGEQLQSIMTDVSIHGFANPTALLSRPVAALTAGSTPLPSAPSVTTPSPSGSDERSEVLETLELIATGYGITPKQLVERWKQPMLQLQRVPLPKRNHVAAVVSTILSDPDLVKDDEAKLKTDDEVGALRQLVRSKDDAIEAIGAELRLDPAERGNSRAIKDKVREARDSASTLSRLKSVLGDADDLAQAAKDLKARSQKADELVEHVKQAVHGRRLSGRGMRVIVMDKLSDEDKAALGL